MISMTHINTLSRALPRCDLTNSNGDLLVLDRHGEIIGRIDLDAGVVRVFDNYEHRAKVKTRLKRAGIPCSFEDPASGALRILYEPLERPPA